MSSSASKLAYLQKYLSQGDALPGEDKEEEKRNKKKKKKNKDKKNAFQDKFKSRLIDADEVFEDELEERTTTTTKTKEDGGKDGEEDAEDRYDTMEDRPQIAGFVDDRPEIEIMKERFTTSTFVPVVKIEDDDDDDSNGPTVASFGGDNDVRVKEEPQSEEETSPRRRRRNDSSDGDNSPPRRRRDSPGREKDISPPRRRRRDSSDGDKSPPRRRRKSSSEKSPPRQKRRLSPELNKKKRRGGDSSDNSPPRRSDAQSSSSRVKKEPRSDDDDISPPRKRRENDDLSPPRRKEVKREPDSDGDISPPRRTRPGENKMSKTLDGKLAGLQDGKSLKAELDTLRRKERDVFEKLSTDVSGRGAETKVRGRLREKEEMERRKKEENEITDEVKKKFSRWGKGVKQTEQIQARIANDLHEMDKPLARSANDVDLDSHLRMQERDEDPMLQYMRKKKMKQVGGKQMPKYQGPAPAPNRFGIPPGYRWDGVDRSTGFEKKLFQQQNSRKALEEDAYKWSTEEM